jgi:hypothetical protein
VRFVWLGVAIGCGPDVCERDEQADLVCGRPHPVELTAECQEDLKVCTGADRRALSDYQDCLEESGALDCDVTTEAAPTEVQTVDCFDLLADLTDDCVTARASSGPVE